MRTTIFLSIALTLGLQSCGGGDPQEDAYASQQSGDHEAAVTSFEAALAGMDATSDTYFELSVARCQSLAHVDGDKAEAEFRKLIEADSRINVKQYSLIASELLAASENLSAVNIVDLGVKAFPEDTKMATLLEKVKEAAQSDPAALDALKGMGYLGD